MTTRRKVIPLYEPRNVSNRLLSAVTAAAGPENATDPEVRIQTLSAIASARAVVMLSYHTEIRKQPAPFGNERNAKLCPSHRGLGGDISAREHDAARMNGRMAHDGDDGGCLAGTIRPEQREHRPCRHVDAQIADCADRTIAAAHVFKPQHALSPGRDRPRARQGSP